MKSEGEFELAKKMLLVVAAEAPEGSVWRHRRGGKYIIVGHALCEADLSPLVIYSPFGGHPTWARPAVEFLDGRFTRTDI